MSYLSSVLQSRHEFEGQMIAPLGVILLSPHKLRRVACTALTKR